MNAPLEWSKMTAEQAKVEADALLESMKDRFPKIVEHFNREAVRFNNNELPREAYLQELYCMERTTFEVMKDCSLYIDIFESFKEGVGNKEQIEEFINSALVNLMRMLGVINRHYKILQDK